MPENYVENFTLTNLFKEGAITFKYFPEKITISGKSNWELQNVSIGMKQLFYANREPQRVKAEVWLDKSLEYESIGGEMVDLFDLQEETEAGTPPTLLAQWGEVNLVCVLEDLDIEQTLFSQLGEPLRARVSLSLVEIQDEDASDTQRQTTQPTATTPPTTPTSGGRRTVTP